MNKKELLEKYPYLYETHLHTCQGSACGRNTGYDMAKSAKEAGYTGIIVTDHAWGGNTFVDRSLPWETWVREFTKGYQDAKRYGDANDLDVFWGFESGFQGTEFLIYGVSPEWMIAHPAFHDADIADQHEMVHAAGGMVIHAHPYREEDYIPEIRLFPDLVDGVEAINATHSSHLSQSHKDPTYNEKAIAYAREHGLPMTAGSDVHRTLMLGGGVRFSRRMQSIEDYCASILGKEDYILTDGERYYDKGGRMLPIQEECENK